MQQILNRRTTQNEEYFFLLILCLLLEPNFLNLCEQAKLNVCKMDK